MDSILVKVAALGGNLKSLTAEQKAEYIAAITKNAGLSDSSLFKIIEFDGREVLYADKGVAEMLRSTRGLSFTEPNIVLNGALMLITIGITDGKRTEYDLGSISIDETNRNHAAMVCMTKAKRRATLSFCGLGMIDNEKKIFFPDYDTMDAKQLFDGVNDYITSNYDCDITKLFNTGFGKKLGNLKKLAKSINEDNFVQFCKENNQEFFETIPIEPNKKEEPKTDPSKVFGLVVPFPDIKAS